MQLKTNTAQEAQLIMQTDCMTISDLSTTAELYRKSQCSR